MTPRGSSRSALDEEPVSGSGKLEAGDRSVSINLLMRALLTLGASSKQNRCDDPATHNGDVDPRREARSTGRENRFRVGKVGHNQHNGVDRNPQRLFYT